MSGTLDFRTLDVFTAERFRGNPLAVVLDAGGLETAAMQQIAAEFNLSETVFVTAVDAAAGRARVRIFTPRAELPFAGHPTVGTALLLAREGLGIAAADGVRLVLEEAAGEVPVAITLERGEPVRAQFVAPGEASFGPALEPALVAPAFGLGRDDLAGIAPRRAGVGVAFLMAELASLGGLGRAASVAQPDSLREAGLANGAYLYTRATDDGTIRARMFAPLLGIAEDPATGAAAAALAALLAEVDPATDLDGAWRIVQGVEMGRRSVIDVTAEKRAGRLSQVTVAGAAVEVSSGRIAV